MSLFERLVRGRRPATPEEADRLALRQLAGRGANLAESRRVVHILVFQTEEAARSLATDLDSTDYEVTVEAPAGDGEWTVRVAGRRVVSRDTVPGFRAWFERVAREHGGEYEGWEASPTP